MPPGQIFSVIVVVVFILGAFYARHIILQKVSGHSSSRGRFKNRNITIIDRFAISKDNSFCLVEVTGKVYFVAMTNQSITLLDTFEAAAFAETDEESRNTTVIKVPADDTLKNRMTRSLAGFMAKRMGKTLKFESSADESGANFADTMKAANDKDSSGVSENPVAEPPDDPEEMQ